jgi:hypothetical protein
MFSIGAMAGTAGIGSRLADADGAGGGASGVTWSPPVLWLFEFGGCDALADGAALPAATGLGLAAAAGLPAALGSGDGEGACATRISETAASGTSVRSGGCA